MIIDTHAHYDDEAFDTDREALLTSMYDGGIEKIVNVCASVGSFQDTVDLMEKYPFIYGAVGIHPDDADKMTQDTLDEIRRLSHMDKMVAIGEIGLDYYWPENPDRDLQKKCFRDHMALAQELGLPVIVHDREAHQDAMAIVREFPQVRGVFHCYSGAVEDAKMLVRLGWSLSFTGVITFKNARKAPEVIAALPEDRIMIETDSPYLAPVPNRGKRNDSRNLIYIRDRIAEIRGTTPEHVEEFTTRNALRFFGLEG